MRLSEITHQEVLIVVHPGSACGSADFNLGRSSAAAERDYLSRDIRQWNGPIIVIDGDLSDELPRYGDLDQAIKEALSRAKKNKQIALRAYGDDNQPPHQAEVAARLIKKLHLDPKTSRISLTGAWYDPHGPSGCVNSVEEVFARQGFHTDIRDSAIVLTDEDQDDR